MWNEELGIWSEKSWAPVPVLPLTSFGTLSKSYYLCDS